jgi:hypothetical protein
LLAKVFEIDVLACPECGGRMMLIAFIAAPTIAKRILDEFLRECPPRAGSSAQWCAGGRSAPHRRSTGWARVRWCR